MNLSQLLPLADHFEAFSRVETLFRRGRKAITIEGMPVAAKGWLVGRLARDAGHPLLLVTYTEEQAQRLYEDVRTFLPPGQEIHLLPTSLPMLLDDEESERDVRRAGQRLATLGLLASGDAPRNPVIVAPVTALLQKVPPPAVLKNRRIVLKVNEAIRLDTLAARLTAFGYSREDQVNLPGSFARRGDILDVFPPDAAAPYRIDLFGDDIESIRPFDRETQRSAGKIDSLTLVPAHEVAYTREAMASASAALRKILDERMRAMRASGEESERVDRLRDSGESDITRIGQAVYFPGIERYLPLLHPDAVPTLEYFPAETVMVLDEPPQMLSHAERDLEQVAQNLEGRIRRGEILPPPVSPLLPAEKTLRDMAATHATLSLSLLARAAPWLPMEEHIAVQGAPAEGFAGRPGLLGDALATYRKANTRVVIVSLQAPRVRGVLQDRELPESPLNELTAGKSGIALVNGALRTGFKLTDARLVVLTDAEIFGTPADRGKPKQRREFREGMRITNLIDLKEGDFVVHIYHGIGVYRGLTRMTVQGVEKEYLLIQYEGSDKLYVPVDQVDRVQKYIGSEGSPPQVNRLGGNDWARTTAKAQRQAREIAKDLIELYAARQAAPGYSYAPDTPWQQEMEDAFPYTETPDQDAAIRDVKKDLESPRPMDRLICGDVGFGKTEVAIRAAFKVASEGRQVAILCPTTVLAAQHFATFSERLAAFPVRVDMLSRFRSSREQAKTVEDIKLGAVDIVIGTHRLLSKDIEFKDLGLVIVDEEQRFGVTHKERLKQLRKTVDVLAMSATPIPRTLQMSLSGIRDMSLINDPPEGRTPVKTFIKEYDDDLVREAIERELERGGQAYFVHNRVESIYHIANRLEKITPNARFRVAHGQMNEDDLEEAMLDFYEHKFDVLVCTTIVESGLDIPNVNTILIDNADKLGLSQLYQLRGRVGRSRRQAYAYLMYRKSKSLTTIAEQRLDAMREYGELGSGYKVALRDLELRGAGNMLGADQSGTVSAVGLDLYMQLLEQAVREYKGEEQDKEAEPLPTVDLPVAAAIPAKYVPSEAQRILMYKKLSAVRQRDDVARLQEEFEDRFGDPPAPVWNALALLRLRLRAQEVGIESITTDAGKIQIVLKKGVRLPTHTIRPLITAFKAQAGKFDPDRISVNIVSSKVLNQVEEMVEVIARALEQKTPPRVSPGGSGPAGYGAKKAAATRN
ncbi:MAG TPA: transcription-repair coupling factor [Armatimonadaceae bacterium]|nr:transcription-repair coupling factor [Armatimonadaceae bacterium]